MAAIQNSLGIRDIDACIEQVNGVVSCGSEVSFADINRWASALKENHVGQQLGKYKAVLELEDCTDVETAISLAGRLDEYEFCPDAAMQDVLGRYIQNADQLDYDEEMDAAEEFGIADTDYGIVKRADSTPGQCSLICRCRR